MNISVVNSEQSVVSVLCAAINAVAPVLAAYTQDGIVDELWHNPGLSMRDRSFVALSTFVSRNATLAYPYYFD